MIVDIAAMEYKRLFPTNPHPFLSNQFIEVNEHKVERVLRLVDDCDKPSLGIIVGLKNGMLISHFSAPFGGFHFSHELIYINVIYDFISKLKSYVEKNKFRGIEITLPPDFYHQTINSKLIHSLINSGFNIKSLDITNYVDLDLFENKFRHSSSHQYLKQAIRHGLVFRLITEIDEKIKAYELIRANRIHFSRPIFMTFDDLIKINTIWDTDYFGIYDKNNEILASAIFYRAHKSIGYVVFWGDNELGRPQRSMDFCTFNLLNHYKQIGYRFIDLGISTENGIPNEGLLRFKETHECISSLRYSFKWINNV